MTVGLILPLLLTACSVSTPRDGLVASSARVAGDRAAATSAGSEPDVASLDADATSAGVSSREHVRCSRSTGGSHERRDGKGPGSSAPARLGDGVGRGLDRRGHRRLDRRVGHGRASPGPTAALFKAFVENGYGLWADEVNDQGGINGRTHRAVKLVDNRDTAEGGVAACKEVRGATARSSPSAWTVSGAPTSARSDCLDEAGIPVSPATSPATATAGATSISVVRRRHAGRAARELRRQRDRRRQRQDRPHRQQRPDPLHGSRRA